MLIKLISFHEISNFALSIHDYVISALHHRVRKRDDHLHNRKKRCSFVTIAAFYLAPAARSHSRPFESREIHTRLFNFARTSHHFQTMPREAKAYKKARRKQRASRFLSSASVSLSFSFCASDFSARHLYSFSVHSRKSEPFQGTRLHRTPSACLYPFRWELSGILGRVTMRALTMIKGIRGSLLMERTAAPRAREYRSITSGNADNCIGRKYMDAR